MNQLLDLKNKKFTVEDQLNLMLKALSNEDLIRKINQLANEIKNANYLMPGLSACLNDFQAELDKRISAMVLKV